MNELPMADDRHDPAARRVLALYPGGYPLHIDLAERDVGGIATGLRFTLPPNGLNLPLRHQLESKLVMALHGRLQIRSGRAVLATLEQGTGVVLNPNIAHRIAQHGAVASVVGVVLWPGSVEQAFRRIAHRVSVEGPDKAAMKAILAEYGVSWDDGLPGQPKVQLDPQPAAQAVHALPPPVQAAVRAHLADWLI